MLSKEEIDRYRKEQLDINDKRKIIIEKFIVASDSGDRELAHKLIQDVRSLVPDYCEHGRSHVSTCIACDEKHKECFPENYTPCAKCKELFDPDELYEEGKCDQCYYEEK